MEECGPLIITRMLTPKVRLLISMILKNTLNFSCVIYFLNHSGLYLVICVEMMLLVRFSERNPDFSENEYTTEMMWRKLL